jgi:hypothetical protein
MDYLLWSEEEIIERVDEYSLYCSYLDYEPLIGAKYISPIRSSTGGSPDTDPSFGIFERKYGKGPHEFMWKDQGKGLHGDIFDLVKCICNLHTRRDAMLQVLIDSGMVEGPRSRPIIDIQEKRYQGYATVSTATQEFTHKDLSFWGRINVDKGLLGTYNVRSVRAYWLYEDQKYPRYPRGLGFEYKIWDKRQLYFPWAPKKMKFRTDWTEACVPGFLQLQYNSPLLVITKSMKDVICLRSFGYEAISPRGENILLPPECLAYMKRRYQRILILFDNDMKHKGEEYEFPKIYVPQEVPGDKDTSDFCTNHGAQATAEMLRQITDTYD